MADARGDREHRRGLLLEEQAALRRVATLVARGVTSAELFATVSDEVGRLFDVEVAIARFEPDGSAMVVVGLTPGMPVVNVGTLWKLEDYLASTAVYRTGRPARNDHTGHRDEPGPVAESLRQMHFVSTVAVPITVEGHIWGVLTVSDRHKPLPPDTQELVERFTELVATAIANAESRAELATSEARAHELAREQVALRRVATLIAKGAEAEELFAAVAQEVAEVFGIPVVGVQRFETDGTFTIMGIAGETEFAVGSRWPIEDQGMAAAILQTGRPTWKEDYATMPGPLGAAVRHGRMIATVGVPIIVERGMWGFIGGAAKPGLPIPPKIEDRLARFTELVATAIANGQTREDLRQLADEQAALGRVAMLVARGVGPSEVFATVSNEVAQLFGGVPVAIGRFDADGSSMTIVGMTPGIPIVTIGTRLPLVDSLASTPVYRTGRPSRTDHAGVDKETELSADYHQLLAGLSTVATPIVVEDRLWGSLTISDFNKPLPPGTEERAMKFTELVGMAIANADSREELSSSRARIVAAADDARRRIEHDLHDGAQQRLVTLAVALRRTEPKIPEELDAVRAELARVADGLTTAVDELRELSRGIHPSILTEGGLSPALKALGRRSAIRVKLNLGFEHRLPDHVEVAAYYTVSEALTNASKHANASCVWVVARLEDAMLEVSIHDDGVGGAEARRGSGLTGLTDRIEALGGSIQIESPIGSGTTIRAQIPTR